MTDGIRKISPQITPPTVADVNEAKAQEISAKITENNTELKILRDTVEAARNSSSGTEFSKLLNQQGNQDLKSSGFTAKVDSANANLLNQQLTTARLGTPLFAKQTQQDPGKISERNQTLPTYFFKQAEVARDEKIKDCDRQIKGLKEDIGNLQDQIIGLDQQLAKVQEEYERTGDPDLLKKMDSIRNQIDDLKYQIQQKEDQIKDLKDEMAAMVGRTTEEPKKAQDINS